MAYFSSSKRVAATVAAAVLTGASLTTVQAITPEQEPTGTCAVTKWNFDQAGVDAYAYTDPQDLLNAVLEAKDFEVGKVGHRIVFGYWKDRVNEAVKCGFVEEPAAEYTTPTFAPAEPTDEPTVEPTAEPTPTLRPTPTVRPTLIVRPTATPTATPTEPTPSQSGTCSVTKWNFDQAGVDMSAYSDAQKLLDAVLAAKEFEEGKVGYRVVFGYWKDRVNEAVDCGFVKESAAEYTTPAKPTDFVPLPEEDKECTAVSDRFAKVGVDVEDYSSDRTLLKAALKADGYEADNFLHQAKFGTWNGRVDDAVDCGFVTKTVTNEELEPGLNAITPCGSLNYWLNREGFNTATLTHGELSKKLRDSNRGDKPLGNVIGVEYFDDIADRALQCRLVEPDANDFWAGSSKTADLIAAGTDLGSSFSSEEGEEQKQSSGDDLRTGTIVGGVILGIAAIIGIVAAALPHIKPYLPENIRRMLG